MPYPKFSARYATDNCERLVQENKTEINFLTDILEFRDVVASEPMVKLESYLTEPPSYNKMEQRDTCELKSVYSGNKTNRNPDKSECHNVLEYDYKKNLKKSDTDILSEQC